MAQLPINCVRHAIQTPAARCGQGITRTTTPPPAFPTSGRKTLSAAAPWPPGAPRRGPIRHSHLAAWLFGLSAGLAPFWVAGDPVGEARVFGDVAVSRPDQHTTTIDQASSSAILEWDRFSIAASETVEFRQPSASAVILNRVVGRNPSEILGTMRANGHVFLVNPNGVFFGPGASIDVQGLVATTMNVSDSDFVAGRYRFTGDETPKGRAAVTNAGHISSRAGGYVVLAGDYVENRGVISARAGHVVLASGRQVTLDLEGDGLVSFAVDEATLDDHAGVRNTGSILADGSNVVMTARVASTLAASAVNNEGLIRATGIAEKDGTIHLTAESGNVRNPGTLQATDIFLDADGDADLDGATIAAERLVDITARGDVDNGAAPASWTTGALRVRAGGVIDLGATAIRVGTDRIPGPAADPGLADLLNPLDLSPADPRPNAWFSARDGITLGPLSLDGDYLVLETDNLVLDGGTVTNADAVIQLLPSTRDAGMSLEDEREPLAQINIGNSEHIQPFSDATVVLGGTGYDGDVDIGTLGDIDVGDTNLVLLTNGKMAGFEHLLSKGILFTNADTADIQQTGDDPDDDDTKDGGSVAGDNSTDGSTSGSDGDIVILPGTAGPKGESHATADSSPRAALIVTAATTTEGGEAATAEETRGRGATPFPFALDELITYRTAQISASICR